MLINRRASLAAAFVAVTTLAATLASAETPSPAGAAVYFINLKDGDTVTSPFKIQFGLTGMGIAPAGTQIPNTGHHHLLIDAGDSIPAGQVVPKDSTHLHFGKAQSSATVTLSPGKHVLTLQFADGIHRSYGSQMAATINVTVK